MPNFNNIKAPDGTSYVVEDTTARNAASVAQSDATAAQSAAAAAQQATVNITNAINGKGILSLTYEADTKAVVFTSSTIDIQDAAAMTISAATAAGLE